MYLYVPFQEDEQKVLAQLPSGLTNLTGELTRVMELDLVPERKLARAQAGEVIEALQTKGFFLQMPPNDLLKNDSSMLRDDADTF